MSKPYSDGSGRNPREHESGAFGATAVEGSYHQKTTELLEVILSRKNLLSALHRVISNRGAPGLDGMDVDRLRPYLRDNWPILKASLLNGTYVPQPVKRVYIPKDGSLEKRGLGIPTVVDRLIQQAIHQVLAKIFEPSFSKVSFGCIKGRSAHQAVSFAKQHVESGHRFVVDMDIEKFFDRVHHDILMSRVARKIQDKRLLLLIRRYLQAGVLEAGVVLPTYEGTPQGGPLSPLLANILLDDLDKELERRGHKFCRYVDDCNIYVKSYKAGVRVLSSIEAFLHRVLKLKLNDKKSRVTRPWSSQFLGFSMTINKKPKLKPGHASLKRFRWKVKKLLRKGRGRNLVKFITYDFYPFLRGWINYFRLCDVVEIFKTLDGLLRRHLRRLIWKQWKRPWTRFKRLLSLGLCEVHAAKSAFNGRGPWWNSGAKHLKICLPDSIFESFGLVNLRSRVMSFSYSM